MAQMPVEMAKDLALTLIQAGRLSPEEMPDTLQRTHAWTWSDEAEHIWELIVPHHPSRAFDFKGLARG